MDVINLSIERETLQKLIDAADWYASYWGNKDVEGAVEEVERAITEADE